MKIKLIAQGFDKFTGVMGVTEFLNGVSVNQVSRAEARLLSAVVSVVDAKTGRPVGDLQEFDDAYSTSAVSVRLPTLAELQARAAAASPATPRVEATNPSPDSIAAKVYAAEELATVADTEGIAGLRAIAEPLGVKASSITKLIAAILEAQNKAGERPTFLGEGEPNDTPEVGSQPADMPSGEGDGEGAADEGTPSTSEQVDEGEGV